MRRFGAMSKISTKETAEAILRGLPSVLGASVREDIHGHPREVHLLISPGPNPRHLARDVRELLQERLGVPVDQRIISIAQLSSDPDRLPVEPSRPGASLEAGAGSVPRVPNGSAAVAATDPVEAGTVGRVPALGPAPTTGDAAGVGWGRDMESEPGVPDPLTVSQAASRRRAPWPGASQGPQARLIYQGIESTAKAGRIQVRVRLSREDQEFSGEATEVDGGLGRVRAAATAALRAATAACQERVRFEVEAATLTRALGREYVLVAAIAASPLIGRRPISLVGAQPVDAGSEVAAVLAALQATNRVIARALTSS
jgi:hypothetical protein